MLELVDIVKNYYLKDQEPVRALRGINLKFRKNEFVAVLGHSGCGKTTLLNIIGGLDKYTSGDLIIEGKSTKNFDDRDWDTYRNHSIGFVFQSYNLIPHQNLLQNVELALTISGIGKEERKERALNALAKVGLEKFYKKKPNQLSGGQMQRVAIARALVNDPEILLADEPTGALDSETSVQIMDLLKEVAMDRLVIMVTHNPDLANQYANRIVRMSDGNIVSDSNPFDGKEIVKENKGEKVNKGTKKSSMSFFTAFALSFSNLIAKLKRTILVTIAGSIGIIGIAAVLSVSNGVTNFIDDMQNSMLSSYPLTIAEESVDYTSLMVGMDSWKGKEIQQFDKTTQVGLSSMIDYLMSAYQDFTSIKTNDINDNLLAYIDGISSEDAAVIQKQYGIDVTNNIFTNWYHEEKSKSEYTSLNGLIQTYISELKTTDGFAEYASYVNLFTNFMEELPNNEDYVLSQYDLIAGDKFATEEDEIMLVVSSDTTMTDLLLAQMGYYNHDEFLNIAKKAIKENEEDNTLTKEELDNLYPYRSVFDFSELIGKELYYFPHDSIYTYGDIANDSYNAISLVMSNGSKVLYLNYDNANNYLSGVSIDTATSEYNTCYLMNIMSSGESANDYDVVKGYWAGICGDKYLIINLNDPTSNSNMMWETTETLDATTIGTVMATQLPIFLDSKVTVTPTTNYIQGYKYSSTLEDSFIGNYLDNNGTKLKIVGILRAKEGNDFGCLSTGAYYTSKFSQKYINDSANSQIVNDPANGIKAFIESGAAATSEFNAYVTFEYYDYTGNVTTGIKKYGYANCLNGDMGTSFSSLFSNLTGVDHFANNQVSLRALSGIKCVENVDGSYTFEVLPSKISIYPYDFDAKDIITTYLNLWNDDCDIKLSNGIILTKAERAELSYSDTIEIIVSIINTLVKIVTIALISFTSLALLVSCFMIAVITYISVMERVKEIGVIRSLGGRKKDVSRLFIAETFITGLFSGVFGILMTGVLCIILNLAIANTGVTNIGALTLGISFSMIGLSIFLNVVSGLIPSMHASHQDPVLALRSE